MIGLDTFPDEIILKVLIEVNQDYQTGADIDALGDTGKTFLNRYTTNARTLRRVCRFWKDLIDQVSSFHFRITTASLCLYPDIHGRMSLFGVKDYQDHLKRARSMLAISYVGRMWLGQAQGDHTYADAELNSISEFLAELGRLPRFRERLIQIDARFDNDEIISYLFGILDSAIANSAIITIRLVGPNGFNTTFVGRMNLSSSLKLSDSDKGVTHLLWPTACLRRLTILSDYGHRNMVIPSSVRYLEIISSLIDLFKLLGNCPSLIELKVGIPADEDDHSAQRGVFQSSRLIMNSLASLDVLSNCPTAAELLAKLSCVNLEHLMITGDRVGLTENNFRVVERVMPLPILKTLELGQMSSSAFELMMSVIPVSSLPSLEKLIVTGFYPIGDGLTPNNLEEHSSSGRAETFTDGVRARSLRLSRTCNSSLPQLQKHFAVELVKTLRIEVPEYDHSFAPVELSCFRDLSSLAIIGSNLGQISKILACIRFGEHLETLEVCHNREISSSPTALSKSRTIWRSFALEHSANGTYSSVTTLITSWQPAFQNINQTLFDLCPRIRTFIFKAIPFDDGDNPWPLTDLEPAQAASVGKGVNAPYLEEVGLEFRRSCDIEDLESIRHIFEEEMPTLLSARHRAGAVALRTMTLRCFSKLDEPEYREYPLECGLLLTLEMADDSC